MSDALPWLMVHGDVAWPIATAVAGALGASSSWVATHLTARRAAAQARRALGPAIELGSARLGERATLEGEIDLSVAHRELRVGGARVRLDGALEIVAGSRESWADGRAIRRELASGDRVRASGTMVEVSTDDASTYRDAGLRLHLTAPRVAFAGAPRARLTRGGLAGGAVFAATVFAVVVLGFVAAAAHLVGVAVLRTEALAPDAPPPLSLTLAAASPFTRSRALADYVARLDAEASDEPVAVARRARLHAILGQPPDAATTHIHSCHAARSPAVAPDLDESLRGREDYAAGDFVGAADAWAGGASDAELSLEDLRFGIGVNLLAHRYDRAAVAARAFAGTYARSGGRDRFLVEKASCLADALDARATGASMPVPKHAAPGECAILALDGARGAARLELAKVVSPDELVQTRAEVPSVWFTLLEVEAGGRPPPCVRHEDPVGDLFASDSRDRARLLPAVQRRLAEAYARGEATLEPCPPPDQRRPESVPDSVREKTNSGAALEPLIALHQAVLDDAAVFARLAGDREGALGLARAHELRAKSARSRVIAAALALPEDPSLADAVVAEATGRHPVSTDPVWELHALRDLVAEDRMGGIELRRWRHDPRPWLSAASHDGDGLAEWFDRGGRPVQATEDAILVVRYADVGGAGEGRFRQWLRGSHRVTRVFRPTETLVTLAALADAARHLGDDVTARDFDERARRFREAVLDRDTSVLLAVLERL